jgi:L-aspartate oxidase
VLHARDATGREISRLLWTRVSADRRIRVVDAARATALVVRDGQCVGATFTTGDGASTATAGRTLLATGGGGQIFRETTNPAIATGDGIALAALAGARVADLEFVQFHPTVLNVEGAPRFLLSEALRGEGARLVNHDAEAFMDRYEPAGDLASRDLVSRAIVREADRTGAPVYLSMAHLDRDFVRRRFPTIAEACAAACLDLARDLIPVSPAAHYVMGGVETDLDGCTSIPGLYAAGEVACTGVHGANRLASNSLLEGLVFGARAAEAMKAPLRAARLMSSLVSEPLLAARTNGNLPSAYEVRDLMWRHVGVIRTGATLERAVDQLRVWMGTVAAQQVPAADPELRRVTSLVTAGLLIARAALRRQESRGAHFRTDFPARDDLHWKTRLADRLHVD